MVNKKIRVIFRADGNSQMGLGHMVRCGALADMIGKEFEKILYTRCSVPSVISSIEEKFSKTILLSESVDSITESRNIKDQLSPTDIVVLDGYHFTEEYQSSINLSGASLVCIDDIHAYPYNASVIINSSGGISPFDYKALPGTQFFLGPQYALLRKPFLVKALLRTNKLSNRNLFICLGGADPENKTLEVVKFVTSIPRFDAIKIVIGSGYAYQTELQEYLEKEQINAELYSAVSAEEMVSIMTSCSYGVCSPSTVSYEYLTVGGVLYLLQIADNQADMLLFLTNEGFAFHLKDALNENKILEQKSLFRQAEVFDGSSGKRFSSIFSKMGLANNIKVRKASKDDSQLFFDWANDTVVREQSYNKDKILLSDHEKWLYSKLNDTNSFIYVLEIDSQPMAQIRFQIKGAEAVLGYLVDKAFRKKGLGTSILAKGISAITNELNKPVAIIGFVKYSNIASQRSFERLRFVKTEATEYPDSYKYVMHYEGN